jgi:hypothetical protein
MRRLTLRPKGGAKRSRDARSEVGFIRKLGGAGNQVGPYRGEIPLAEFLSAASERRHLPALRAPNPQRLSVIGFTLC